MVGSLLNDVQHADWRIGLRFHKATYNARQCCDSHDHCLECMREISEREGALKEGYVTQRTMTYSGLPECPTWTWACYDCFEKLNDVLQWELEEGPPPKMSLKAVVRFRRAFEKYIAERNAKRVGGLAEPEHASAGWRVSQVRGIARAMDIELSAEEAETFLRVLAKPIRESMVGPGADRIRGLLDTPHVLKRIRREARKAAMQRRPEAEE